MRRTDADPLYVEGIDYEVTGRGCAVMGVFVCGVIIGGMAAFLLVRMLGG